MLSSCNRQDAVVTDAEQDGRILYLTPFLSPSPFDGEGDIEDP